MKPVDHWISLAREALNFAYAPYSNFPVAACLVTKNGTTYTGVNIENLSYGLTNCAERTAVFKAVSEGHTEFSHLVVVAKTAKPISPCGACRQVLAEFCSPNMPVTLVGEDGALITTTVEALLPYTFSNEKLNTPLKGKK